MAAQSMLGVNPRITPSNGAPLVKPPANNRQFPELPGIQGTVYPNQDQSTIQQVSAPQTQSTGGYSFNFSGGGVVPQVRERAVQANETVAHHLANLQNSNSRYMLNARRSGRDLADQRGSSNGSYYAGASENAAINAALPIASQDAGWYGRTASENMAAANEGALQGARNQAQFGASGAAAAAGMEEARMRLEASRLENQADREWRATQADQERALTREQWGFDRDVRREDRDWEGNQAERGRTWRDRQSELERTFERDEGGVNFRRQVFGYGMQTILNSPEYMRDPAGAAGLLQFYDQQLNSIFSRIFGGG